jgi:N-methylhydantoinase B
LRKDDLVRLQRPGGGGLGDPLNRPIEKVLEDVRQGYVSVERAGADYGVAVDVNGGEPAVSYEKTARLRGKIRNNSGNDT